MERSVVVRVRPHGRQAARKAAQKRPPRPMWQTPACPPCRGRPSIPVYGVAVQHLLAARGSPPTQKVFQQGAGKAGCSLVLAHLQAALPTCPEAGSENPPRHAQAGAVQKAGRAEIAVARGRHQRHERKKSVAPSSPEGCNRGG